MDLLCISDTIFARDLSLFTVFRSFLAFFKLLYLLATSGHDSTRVIFSAQCVIFLFLIGMVDFVFVFGQLGEALLVSSLLLPHLVILTEDGSSIFPTRGRRLALTITVSNDDVVLNSAIFVTS
jgi:hypothetical protein